jgi:hypothetical protein
LGRGLSSKSSCPSSTWCYFHLLLSFLFFPRRL